MSDKTALRLAFCVMLCALCGCASGSLNSGVSNRYEVAVDFFSLSPKTVKKVEITTNPDVPFVVQTQDEAGNHYEVDGTLRQKTAHTFRLDQLRISAPSHLFQCASLELELDKEWGVYNVISIAWSGFSIRITKKMATPSATMDGVREKRTNLHKCVRRLG
jgi:hypothetical protein